MIALSANTMRAIVPLYRGNAGRAQATIIETVGPFLMTVLDQYHIDTRLRAAHFLAQIAHESAGFRTLEEFATGAEYEGRVNLGNTVRGDGKRFKGRGLIQLTGRDNYSRMSSLLGIDLIGHPEYATLPATALKIACVFWMDHGLNVPADNDDLIAVTQAINGGQNGIDSRRAYLAKAKVAVTMLEAANVPAVSPAEPTLCRGMTGDSVIYLQTTLSRLGARIAIDGEFGAATEAAVYDFQDNHNLDMDGIVGPATWEAIKTAAGVT